MRRKRLLQLVAVVTVSSLSFTFAGGVAGADADGELVIAHLGPETGDLSAIIDPLRVPVEIAVQEINDAGGVPIDGTDTPVRLVTGDDGTDPNVAATTLARLVDSDKADVIIGPASSGTALGIIEDVKDAGVVMCSGSNTSADLSAKKNTANGHYFRTAPPDKLQGPALVELVLSDGYSKVGILTRNDSYGVGFGKALAKALKQGGAKVVANVAYDPEGSTFDSDVQKVADKSPDATIVIGFNDDGAKVVQEMIAQGLGPKDVPLYTADGMQSSSFAETLDPADLSKAEGIKGTAPAGAPAGIESPFQDAFAAAGVDPIFSAYQYDCTILSALAAVKAKSDDPDKIAKAFRSNLTGKEDCNTFATCKDLLADGKTIHWRGASSNFDKFSRHEPNQGVYEVWAYDAAGDVQTEDESSQIKIG